MFRRIAFQVILSAGWRRRLIAFLAGACGALALPPLAVFPALAVTFTLAVWLIDGSYESGSDARTSGRRWRHARKAAAIGWWLGFGYFLAGLWWLGKAFLVEADQFAWALPLGVIGLPAILAFFTAFGFWLSALMWSGHWTRIFALSLGAGLSEWVRAIVLTGFPWNDFGMALGGNIYLAQPAAFIGLHGLTFIAIVLAAAPATLVSSNRPAMNAPRRKRDWLFNPATAALAIVIAIGIYGAMRLHFEPTAYSQHVRLRIMQPNIAQDSRFRPEEKERILKHYFELSGRETSSGKIGAASATHLIWPESAFPFILTRDPEALARLGEYLPAGVILLTGAARREDIRQGGRTTGAFYNSIHAIIRGGSIIATYDKVRLVPFGEYLPFSSVLEKLRLRQFVTVPGGFTAGASRQPMVVPGLPPLAPLVCYEAIFPGAVIPPHREGARPGLMLNVTNDAWFGITPGPYQHLYQARLRAIEEGVPLVRAANSGISAVIDPLGRIVSSLPLGAADVLDARLPLPHRMTVFAANPLLAPGLCALLVLMIVLAGLWLDARRKIPAF